MPLTREQVQAKILAYKSQHAKREPVELDWFPEAGIIKDGSGNVLEDNRLQIRETMGDEGIAFDKEAEKDLNRAVGRLMTKCLLMPDGKTPAFDEGHLIALMSELGNSVLMPLLSKIQTLSGRTPTAQADAAGNLPATPPVASSTN